MLLSADELELFSHATCAHPHSLLGMHAAKSGRTGGIVVRAFLRDAVACAVVDLGKDAAHPMERVS